MVRILGTLFLMLAVHGHLQAEVVIVNPTGLAVGQQFRIMVVTTRITIASPSTIDTYNTFVANDTAATNYTYNGVTVSFKAWGSTATVNAKDNIGWTVGNQTDVYRPTGVLISTADNFLTTAHADGVTETNQMVWTGTTTDGGLDASRRLGASTAWVGYSDRTGGWTQGSYLGVTGNAWLPLYGISDVMTVAAVPEPGTYILCAMSTTVLAAMIFFRRRRQQRERLRLAAVSAE